jgi:hypothetical protein
VESSTASAWFRRHRHTVIIILFVILNAALRVPTTPRMVFRDSYVEGALIDGISKTGSLLSDGVSLRFKPDSLSFGYSFPPLYPTLVSSFTQFSGAGTEEAGAFLSVILGVVGFFSSYLLAREFFGAKVPAYITAFAYSTAPVFASTTAYTLLPRSLFAALLPASIWMLLKHGARGDRRFLNLSVYTALTLYLTHRMGLLVILLYLAYFSAGAVKKHFEGRRSIGITSKLLPVLYVTAAFLLVLWSMNSEGIITQFRQDYSTGFMASGKTLKVELENLLADYLSNAGVLSVFAVVGFAHLLLKSARKNLTRNEILLLAVVFLITPLTSAGEYTIFLLLPAISLLASDGLLLSLSVTKNKLRPTVCAIILASTLFTLFMTWHWLSVESRHHMTRPHWLDERVVHAVEHSQELNGSVLAPEFDDLMAEHEFLGGGETRFSWFYYGFRGPPKEGNETWFILESETFAGKFYGPYDNIVDSLLLKTLHNTGDKVYSNSLITFWAT